MACTYNYNGETYTEQELSIVLKMNIIPDLEGSKKFLQETLGMEESEIQIVSGLIDNYSLGRYLSDGRILLSNISSPNVAYHEGFHRVWNLSLSDKTINEVTDYVKALYNYRSIIDSYKERYNNPDIVKTRGYSLSEDMLIEEYLADEFAEYAMTGVGEQNIITRAFQVIINFFTKLFKTTPEDLYAAILRGEYKSIDKSKVNNFYKDSIIKLNDDFNGDLEIENRIDINHKLTQLYTEALLEKGLFLELSDKRTATSDKIKTIYDEAYSKLVTEIFLESSSGNLADIINFLEELGDKDAIENFKKDLIKSHQRYLASFKLDNSEFVEDLEKENDSITAGDAKEGKDRSFNKKSSEEDPRKNMDKHVRLLLGMITYKDNVKDSNELIKAYPLNTTITILLNHLSGTPPSYNTFKKKLTEIANTVMSDTNLIDVIDLIFPSGEYMTEESLYITQSFIKSFSNTKYNYDSLHLNNDRELTLLNENEFATTREFKKEWSTDFYKEYYNLPESEIGPALKKKINGTVENYAPSDNTISTEIQASETVFKGGIKYMLSNYSKDDLIDIIKDYPNIMHSYMFKPLGMSGIIEAFKVYKHASPEQQKYMKLILTKVLEDYEIIVEILGSVSDSEFTHDSMKAIYTSSNESFERANAYGSSKTYIKDYVDFITKEISKITSKVELSISSATNNPIYTIGNLSYLTQKIDSLNYVFSQGESFEEFENINTTNSVLLNYFKTKTERTELNEMPITVKTLSGFKSRSTAEDFDKTGKLEYYLTGLLGVKEGQFYSITQGDRANYPMFKIPYNDLVDQFNDNELFVKYAYDALLTGVVMSKYYSGIFGNISSNLENNIDLAYLFVNKTGEKSNAFIEKFKKAFTQQFAKAEHVTISEHKGELLFEHLNFNEEFDFSNVSSFIDFYLSDTSIKAEVIKLAEQHILNEAKYVASDLALYDVINRDDFSVKTEFKEVLAPLIQETKIPGTDNTYPSLRKTIYEFAKMYTIMNIEQMKLIYGSIGNFKSATEFGKRFNTPTSTGIPAGVQSNNDPILETIEEIENSVNNTYTINGVNYSYSRVRNSLGLERLESREAFIADIKGTSKEETIEMLKEYHREEAEKNIRILYLNSPSQYDTLIENFGSEEAYIENYAENAEPYTDYEEADGFSYLNLFEWRRLLKMWGEWHPVNDKIFETELAIFNIANDNSLSQEEKEIKIGQKTLELPDYSVAAMMKPIYTGSVYNGGMKNHVKDVYKNVNIYGLRKTSFFPMMPSITWNTNHHKLHNEMLSKGVGFTFVNSAAKLGINRNNISAENAAKGDFTIPDKFTTLDYRFMKKSQVIAPKSKVSIPDSTQSRKNMIATKYDNNMPIDWLMNMTSGLSIDDTLSYEDYLEDVNSNNVNFINLNILKKIWDTMSEEDRLNASEDHRNVQEYIDTITVIVDRARNALVEELEIIETSENEFKYVTSNIKKVFEIIKSESIDRNEPIYILDALDHLIETEGLVLDGLPNKAKLESLISSLVTNRVIRNKRPGDGKAQNAVTFWGNSERELSPDKKLYESDELKFYRNDENGNLLPAECMLPTPPKLMESLKNLLNKKSKMTARELEISNIHNDVYNKYKVYDIENTLGEYKYHKFILTETLNIMIERGLLDEEITFKGLRIPNQELSSNDIIKVKKFIVPSLEAYIVLPSQIVAKTGSDFDIDKMMIYFNNIDLELKSIDFPMDNSKESIEYRFSQIKKSKAKEQIKDIEFDLQETNRGISIRDTDKIIKSFRNKKIENLKSSNLQLNLISEEEAGELMNKTIKIFKDKISGTIIEDLIDDTLNKGLSNIDTYKLLVDTLSYFFNKDVKIEITDNIKKAEDLYETLEYKLLEELNNYLEDGKSLIDYYNNVYDQAISKAVKSDIIEFNSVIEELLTTLINVTRKEFISKKQEILNSSDYEDYLQVIKNFELDEFVKANPTAIMQTSDKALQNKLLNVEKKLILSNASDLFHSIGDAGLKDLVISNIDGYIAKANNLSMFKKSLYSEESTMNITDALSIKYNINKKIDMQDAGMGIGIVANAGTAHPIQSVLEYNDKYIYIFNSTTNFEIPSTIPIMGGLKPNLSKSTMADGTKVIHTNSGYLTTQVDINKDPYPVQLSINKDTLPVIMYLERNGVPTNIIHTLLASPIVSDYIKYRALKTGPLYKSISFTNRSAITSEFISRAYKIFNNTAVAKNAVSDIEKLFKAYDPNYLTNKKLIESIDLYDFNVLAAFLVIENQASINEDIRSAFSADTKFHKNAASYINNFDRLNSARATGLFKESSISKIVNKGLLKSFNKGAELYYYPWISTFLSRRQININIGDTIKTVSSMVHPYNSNQREKMMNAMENQYILYLMKHPAINFSSIASGFTKDEILMTKSANPGKELVETITALKRVFPDDPYIQLLNTVEIDGVSLIDSKTKTNVSEDINLLNEAAKHFFSKEVTTIVLPGNIKKEINLLLFAYQLTAYNMFQTKNSIATNTITHILPGAIKIDIMNSIVEGYKSAEPFLLENRNEFINNFIGEFLILNDNNIRNHKKFKLIKTAKGNFIEETTYGIQYKVAKNNNGAFYNGVFETSNGVIKDVSPIIETIEFNYYSKFNSPLLPDSINGKYNLNGLKVNLNPDKTYLTGNKINYVISDTKSIVIGEIINDTLMLYSSAYSIDTLVSAIERYTSGIKGEDGKLINEFDELDYDGFLEKKESNSKGVTISLSSEDSRDILKFLSADSLDYFEYNGRKYKTLMHAYMSNLKGFNENIYKRGSDVTSPKYKDLVKDGDFTNSVGRNIKPNLDVELLKELLMTKLSQFPSRIPELLELKDALMYSEYKDSFDSFSYKVGLQNYYIKTLYDIINLIGDNNQNVSNNKNTTVTGNVVNNENIVSSNSSEILGALAPNATFYYFDREGEFVQESKEDYKEDITPLKPFSINGRSFLDVGTALKALYGKKVVDLATRESQLKNIVRAKLDANPYLLIWINLNGGIDYINNLYFSIDGNKKAFKMKDDFVIYDNIVDGNVVEGIYKKALREVYEEMQKSDIFNVSSTNLINVLSQKGFSEEEILKINEKLCNI